MPPARSLTWLFDLDNTLHNANHAIFPHINLAMRQYIERHLGLSTPEADAVRQRYWERYGATLLGLVRHHQTDPAHFLAATHDFPDLASLLRFDPALRHALARLPGKKIIFSNAPRAYTKAVLQLTGLRHFFSAIYTVEDTRLQPKPLLGGFRRLLAKERLQARRCILVEDTLANLVAAKRLGMKTVWITGGRKNARAVDVRLTSCRNLPREFRQLRL